MSLATSINPSKAFMDIEQQLESKMQPISPREEYINKLRDRLITPPTILYENPEKGWGLVVIFVGLFSGVLITWLLLFLFRKKRPS
ncbi:MAG: hypothetical protein HPY76_08505 [Anaerolineae bacterium]|jgi:hypothetical protein|nr:hypothetical protein [Anaerolineae bacterium]